MSKWTRASCALPLAAALSMGMVAFEAAAQVGPACVPVKERKGREFGCFITARQPLPKVPRAPLYWYLDQYPDLKAARAAKGPTGTVVESVGKVWLFTIETKGWKPGVKERVAEIGPLPLVSAKDHAAVYMEGVFKPGMKSPVHRHPGVEAWYTLEGEMCVETPQGKQVQRAGGPGVIVPGGFPMELSGSGTGTRRSIVLILQDATKPSSTPAHDWKPKGLCAQP